MKAVFVLCTVHRQDQLGCRPLSPSSLFLSLSVGPFLWSCSVLLYRVPGPGGSPKCSLCSWHLHRSFSAFPDMTHLTSTHSHRDSGSQGPIQRESFRPPHQSPLLPLSQSTATSCLRECQDPTGTSLAAEGGREETWEAPSPSPFGACTASNPIHLLSVLWPPAINRGSDSIFFKNKHQTVTTGPEKHSLAVAGWGHCVQAPASGH